MRSNVPDAQHPAKVCRALCRGNRAVERRPWPSITRAPERSPTFQSPALSWNKYHHGNCTFSLFLPTCTLLWTCPHLNVTLLSLPHQDSVVCILGTIWAESVGMDDKSIPSCHPLSKDHGSGTWRASTVPWHKTGKGPTARGVDSRG